MAFRTADLVKETTTTTGTGAVTLAGAVSPFQTFAQGGLTNGDVCYYWIGGNTSAPTEWEIGIGTWNTGGTLSRTTVLQSSNSDAAVNFSAGTKTVILVDPAGGARHQLAGTALIAPLKLASGTLLTTPEAGAFEYDGVTFSNTIDVTSGRGISPVEHIFKLTANGSAIGATIADFFGTGSALPLVASATYALEAELYLLKTTAGTVTLTLNTSAASYTNIVAQFINGTIGAVAAMTGGGIHTTTTAAAALPASNSLTTATNYWFKVWGTIETNAAGSFKIRATESAGTITPLRGSFMKLRRLPAGNVGLWA